MRTGPRRFIAQKAIDLGARFAVGWDRVTYAPAAKRWTDRFFFELRNSKTIFGAAESAGRTFSFPFDSHDGWQVLGEQTFIINTAQINVKNADTPNTVSQSEFDMFLQVFDYATYPLKDGGTRYYKTINGALTNDFYDVLDDSRKIIKSQNTISQKDVEKASKPTTETN